LKVVVESRCVGECMSGRCNFRGGHAIPREHPAQVKGGDISLQQKQKIGYCASLPAFAQSQPIA
jgi:hypothetical protein